MHSESQNQQAAMRHRSALDSDRRLQFECEIDRRVWQHHYTKVSTHCLANKKARCNQVALCNIALDTNKISIHLVMTKFMTVSGHSLQTRISNNF